MALLRTASDGRGLQGWLCVCLVLERVRFGLTEGMMVMETGFGLVLTAGSTGASSSSSSSSSSRSNSSSGL